jgi:hypothetical protein
LELSATAGSFHNHTLRIHSSTTEQAIAALDLLVGLQDSYFKKMGLRYFVAGSNEQRPPTCPLRGRHLEIFVRNANRENRFGFMVFSPAQCRTLASNGIRTNIDSWGCQLPNHGIAFVKAFTATENQESGSAKLSIWTRLPFNERNLRLLLSQHKLEFLTLHYTR